MQNPFLICYCEPHLYMINPFEKSIIISFQNNIADILLLEGRFAVSYLNMVGVGRKSMTIFTADVEKYPVFGVEIN